jgi:hypothetical protein
MMRFATEKTWLIAVVSALQITEIGYHMAEMKAKPNTDLVYM